MVAVDVLLGRRADTPAPDVVLCVVDANNLERNLYLVSQVLELGRPTVVALTMTDVAESRGLAIDVERLARAARRAGRAGPGAPTARARPAEAGAGRGGRSAADGLPRARSRRHSGTRSPGSTAAIAGSNDAGQGPPAPLSWSSGSCSTRAATSKGMSPSTVEPSCAGPLRDARARLAEAGCPVPAVEAMARYGWAAAGPGRGRHAAPTSAGPAPATGSTAS